ncbi:MULTISPECIES: DUF2283 domain-containing protein [Anoxybacillus]|uniref:DUF2283 domain-containing protein n=2 Tax=Anoxybacillus TaxID=150247 RepID=A0A2G5RRQ3_9BACL|nr:MULTISPECIES: DUF2283 domain-containing protein [Anoxybacillus]MED0688006.1 DUF2283 domain-containing protein [Anoxybacillus ayderensis]PIC05528.1 DUF2283 domain-containing protein [Anoxybacillus flavithermus]
MKEPVKIHYDEECDVLYISFGEPRPSYAEDFEDGVYIRYDMETDALTGVTILDFSKRKNELKNMPWPFTFPTESVNEVVH